MEKEHTWNLIAKKLSVEASPEELQELEILMRQDPGLHYSMQAIFDLWQSRKQDDFEKKQAFLAFWRHMERMQALGVEYPARKSRGADKNNFPDKTNLHEEIHEEIRLERHEERLEERSEERLHTTKTPPGNPRVFWLAALSPGVLAAFFVLAFVIFKTKRPIGSAVIPPERNSEITTRNGSRTNLLLPDGTRIWLNAGSRLNYDKHYGLTSREVSLTGEAFFDVTRNAEKPFIIHTDRMDIKVLGTSFNIRAYPTDKTSEATLVHGSIEVSIRDKPGAKIILKPNEKLIVGMEDSTHRRNNTGQPDPAAASNESRVTIRKPTYEQNTGTLIETSWVDNKLVFQGEEFGALAKDLERWYGVSIRFTDPGQQHWRFTGTFQKETIEQALDALKMTAGFIYMIEGTQISIFTKK